MLSLCNQSKAGSLFFRFFSNDDVDLFESFNFCTPLSLTESFTYFFFVYKTNNHTGEMEKLTVFIYFFLIFYYFTVFEFFLPLLLFFLDSRDSIHLKVL